MKNSLNNILKGVLTIFVAFAAITNVNAASNIVEEVDGTTSSYTINRGDTIIGVTRFESGKTIDATSVLVAAKNNFDLLGTFATTAYVYDGDDEWYPVVMGEGLSTTVMTDAEVTAAGLDEVAVYYINNEEKQLTIDTGLELNEDNSVVVTYKGGTTDTLEVNEDGTITIPATATKVEVKASDAPTAATVVEYTVATGETELSKSKGIIYSVINCLQNIDEEGAVTTEYTCGTATEQSNIANYDIRSVANGNVTGYTYANAKTIYDSEGEEVATTNAIALTEDNEYTIKFYFNRNSYTLKYNAPSGFNSPATETVVFGGTATTVPSLGNGYVTYWTATDGTVYASEEPTALTLSESNYSDVETSIIINEDLVPATGNVITLTGAVEAKEYTVTYETEGGTLASGVATSKKVTFNDTYGKSTDETYGVLPTNTSTVTEISKTGYDFKGWWLTKTTAADGTVSYATQITDSSTVTKYENHNLYAKWDLAKYKITYIDAENGVSNVTNSNVISYTINDEDITLGNALRTGYTFDGWYTDVAFTNKVTSIATSEAKDVTLYAKWIGESINVTFKYTDADSNVVTKTLAQTVGAAWNLPTYAGHQAQTLTKSGGGTLVTSKVELTADYITDETSSNYVTITWTDKFNVTYFDGDNELTSIAKKVSYGSEVTIDNTTTKTGYDLEGWYTDLEDATTKVAPGTKLDLTENVTYYANWTPNNITVTLKADNGSAEDETVTVVYNTLYGTIATPVKNGYSFEGWFLDAAYTDAKEVTEETKVTNENAHDLYAKWEKVDYTITYTNAVVGTNGVTTNANPAKYTIETNDITLVDPVRTGYTFGGWYSDEALTAVNVVTTIAKGSTGNKVLYAKWTPSVYSITYANADNTATDITNTNPTKYTIESGTITLVDPIKTGYTFTKWVDGDGNDVTEIVTGSLESYDNITITATFVPNIYTITLNKDNGTGGTDYLYEVYNTKLSVENSLTGADLGTGALSTPTRTGYTFDGYYKEEALTTQLIGADGKTTAAFTNKLFEENATLYAKWTVVDNTINYNLNGGINNSLNPTSYKVTDATITLANPTRT